VADADWKFLEPFNELLFKDVGNKVLHGPFQGMEITAHPVWKDGALSTKLYGTYELELHEIIRMAVARNPKTVVNVGCAEGYYAIGLARLLPEATVYAIDIDFDSLLLVMEYAKRNDVEGRVVCIQGISKPEGLLFEGKEGPRLYILDCEGSEYVLVDLEHCPPLRYSDLIIEYHDFLNMGHSDDLIRKLLPTHAVQKITQQTEPVILELVCNWQFHGHKIVITDTRPADNGWLVCWARNHE
jgi:SAM-dependent methyltransferase